ncbi:hypothetical protein EDB84DRAFT_1678977 [Lactarius hengduanensis]|nr:hypothetical protein EDB84DRAFT_1678977 [Lactarius hengduanensis]
MHCRRLAALVLRPRRLDAAVVRTSTSLRRRRFDTAATPPPPSNSAVATTRPSRHDPYHRLDRLVTTTDHYLDRHNAAAAATSTALTRPRPNTTPFPLVTTSSAPPPTSATSTGTPAPPRQARDGATYTGAVSTRRYCHDSATAAAPTWSPPPLRSATTPTNTARLNHAHRRRPDSALTATPCVPPHAGPPRAPRHGATATSTLLPLHHPVAAASGSHNYSKAMVVGLVLQ